MPCCPLSRWLDVHAAKGVDISRYRSLPFLSVWTLAAGEQGGREREATASGRRVCHRVSKVTGCCQTGQETRLGDVVP